MAPAANTAKTRKAAGQDSDSDGYQGRLEEAEAARIRLRKVSKQWLSGRDLWEHQLT